METESNDKRVFLAVVICAAIFFGWQQIYLKPLTPTQNAGAVASVENENKQRLQTDQNLSSNTSADAKVSSVIPNANKNTTTPSVVSNLKTKALEVSVDSTHGSIILEKLKLFGNEEASIDQLIGTKKLEFGALSPDLKYLNNISYQVSESSEGKLVLDYKDEKLSLKRSYILSSNQNVIDHTLVINFTGPLSAEAQLYFEESAPKEISKQISENEKRAVTYNRVGGVDRTDVQSLSQSEPITNNVTGSWLAISSRYFVSALINKSDLAPTMSAAVDEAGLVHLRLLYKVPAGTKEQTIKNRIYIGPKEVDLLKEAEASLSAVVDFGWFTFLAYPMLVSLKLLYKLIHNYGVAIILLTIFIKLLTYPLTLKSMKGMKEMQRIQPQLQKLRDRYKDDKEKLNQEMLNLMKSNGYNPMSGCLPMFIQMPVFVALYNVLYGAFDLYKQPFFGWIQDLSSKDPFFVTPAVLGLLMFLQQKLTPNTSTDPAQQKMLMMMPVIFGVMMLWLPSGLTLYMLVNSVMSILQQLWINKKLNLNGAKVAA